MDTHTLLLDSFSLFHFCILLELNCNIDSKTQRPKVLFMISMFSFYHSPIFLSLLIHLHIQLIVFITLETLFKFISSYAQPNTAINTLSHFREKIKYCPLSLTLDDQCFATHTAGDCSNTILSQNLFLVYILEIYDMCGESAKRLLALIKTNCL